MTKRVKVTHVKEDKPLRLALILGAGRMGYEAGKRMGLAFGGRGFNLRWFGAFLGAHFGSQIAQVHCNESQITEDSSEA
jgi:hypothetical protein